MGSYNYNKLKCVSLRLNIILQRLVTSMKSLLLLLFIIPVFTANATTYYFSASGNDANNGTSTLTPWKTLSKLNSAFSSFSPGDSLLFKRGDTFYGLLVISSSGSSGSPITIGAYGSGARPIITGFTTLSSWTSLGSGIYEDSCSACQPSLNMVTFQDTLQPMGRWPKLSASNGGYLTIDSHTGYTSLTSTGLSGALNYVGGEVVARKYDYVMDRARITAQSGTTITCAPFTNTYYDFLNNYGFFIQNHVNTCTTLGEWAYDSIPKKIKMYFGGNSPSSYTVQASTTDNLVTINGYNNYITFDNITFKGSNSRTFNIGQCNHIQINNCDIKFSGIDAIWVNNNSSTNNIQVNNCTISYTNNNGIVGNNATNWTITNNSFLNTGMIRGAGGNGDGEYEGMVYIGGKSLIQYNTVKNTGYIGIQFVGDSVEIRNNYVDSFCIVKRDGGGVYTYADTNKLGRKVIGNIITNGIGDNYGIGIDLTNPYDRQAYGIYMDGGTKNVVIDSNTVANCALSGFHFNSPRNIQMKGNTSFNNGAQIDYTDDPYPVSTLTIQNNILFAKHSDQFILSMNLASNYIASIGAIDNNYYCRPILEPSNIDTAGYSHGFTDPINFPYNDGGIAYDNIDHKFKSLDVWQTYFGQDAHTHKSPKTITDVNDIRFEYNATSSPVVVSLPYNYMDVKEATYNGTITLAPYTSAVLIKNGAIINQPPKANAGTDQTITLPTNSINLSGSGTDPDGTISSYYWTKISGLTAGRIANVNSASTSVTGLVQGVYKFELKVTDNNGAAGKDTMQVTVNAAQQSNNLKIYPSPVKGIAMVEINTVELSSSLLLVILDFRGRMIYKEVINSAQYIATEKINMSNFTKGAYTITVFFNGGDKQTVKIIKL